MRDADNLGDTVVDGTFADAVVCAGFITFTRCSAPPRWPPRSSHPKNGPWAPARSPPRIRKARIDGHWKPPSTHAQIDKVACSHGVTIRYGTAASTAPSSTASAATVRSRCGIAPVCRARTAADLRLTGGVLPSENKLAASSTIQLLDTSNARCNLSTARYNYRDLVVTNRMGEA